MFHSLRTVPLLLRIMWDIVDWWYEWHLASVSTQSYITGGHGTFNHWMARADNKKGILSILWLTDKTHYHSTLEAMEQQNNNHRYNDKYNNDISHFVTSANNI